MELVSWYHKLLSVINIKLDAYVWQIEGYGNLLLKGRRELHFTVLQKQTIDSDFCRKSPLGMVCKIQTLLTAPPSNAIPIVV